MRGGVCYQPVGFSGSVGPFCAMVLFGVSLSGSKLLTPGILYPQDPIQPAPPHCPAASLPLVCGPFFSLRANHPQAASGVLQQSGKFPIPALSGSPVRGADLRPHFVCRLLSWDLNSSSR